MTYSTIDNLTEQQWHQQSAADAAKYLRTDKDSGGASRFLTKHTYPF
ncbi:hypothetical protein QUA74_26945 [Microcoleus sp. LAD1_D3]